MVLSLDMISSLWSGYYHFVLRRAIKGFYETFSDAGPELNNTRPCLWTAVAKKQSLVYNGVDSNEVGKEYSWIWEPPTQLKWLLL